MYVSMYVRARAHTISLRVWEFPLLPRSYITHLLAAPLYWTVLPYSRRRRGARPGEENTDMGGPHIPSGGHIDCVVHLSHPIIPSHHPSSPPPPPSWEKNTNTRTAEQQTKQKSKRFDVCKKINPPLPLLSQKKKNHRDLIRKPTISAPRRSHVMIMMLFPFVPRGEIKINSSRPGVLYPLPRHANRTEQWTLPLEK